MTNPNPEADVDIDRAAPVQTTRSIDIAAPPATVWATLADIGVWPRLTPTITAATPTPLEVGRTIHWQAAGWTIASTLAQVEPPHRLAWRGHNQDGTTGVHVWTLQEHGDGTRVTTRESLSGALDDAAAQQLAGQLEAFLADWLAGLRDRVQGTAGPR